MAAIQIAREFIRHRPKRWLAATVCYTFLKVLACSFLLVVSFRLKDGGINGYIGKPRLFLVVVGCFEHNSGCNFLADFL